MESHLPNTEFTSDVGFLDDFQGRAALAAELLRALRRLAAGDADELGFHGDRFDYFFARDAATKLEHDDLARSRLKPRSPAELLIGLAARHSNALIVE